MQNFKSEIRNSPTQQTIKVFLTRDISNNEVKSYLENFNEIELVEIRNSVERNRTTKNITIFKKEGVDINVLHEKINTSLIKIFNKE